MIDPEIIKYLRENLSISIDCHQEFGPTQYLSVNLELEGESISSDTISLPNDIDDQW